MQDRFSKTRARRARRRLTAGFILALVGMVLFAFGIVLLFFTIFFNETLESLFTLGAFALGGFALIVGIFNIGRGLATPAADPLGARLVQTLTPVLDNRHTLLRDLRIADLKPQPDALIIGPGGLMLIKLVDASGVFRCESELWLTRKPGHDFQTWRRNPTREIVQELDALRALLGKRNLPVPLQACIVFTHPQAEISTRQPTIPITALSHLPAHLQHGYLAFVQINEDLLKRTRRALLGRR
jgi:hypothetical protein